MALTLAGPRLWILLKALVKCITQICQKHNLCCFLKKRTMPSAGRFTVGPSSPRILQPRRPDNNNAYCTLTLLDESHSELGAAKNMISNLWGQLLFGRLRLSSNKHGSSRRSRPRTRLRLTCYEPLLSIWKNVLRNPLEILIQVLLSLILIGIFVAQASGSVLSARIVSDSIALSSSRRCWAPDYSLYPLESAMAYSRQCYNASSGTEGCNTYFNQSIGYTTESSNHCPWIGEPCALRVNTSYTLDTDFVSTKQIGINAPKQYWFRRRTTCAPLRRELKLSEFLMAQRYSPGLDHVEDGFGDRGILIWTGGFIQLPSDQKSFQVAP